MHKFLIIFILSLNTSFASSLYNVSGCPKYKGLTRSEFSIESALDQVYEWVEIIEMELGGENTEKSDSIENILAHTGNNLEAIACRMKKRPTQTNFLDFKEIKELSYRYQDLVEEVSESSDENKSKGLITFSKAKLRSVFKTLSKIRPKKEFKIKGKSFDSRDFFRPIEITLVNGKMLRGVIVDVNTVYGSIVVVPTDSSDTEKDMLVLLVPIESIDKTRKIK